MNGRTQRPVLRIDKLLWHLRLAASRPFARQWVEAGHLRCNGQRVTRPSAPIAAGDVLTLPMRSQVTVIEIVSLPPRRGPASEARAHYREIRPDEIATVSQQDSTA